MNKQRKTSNILNVFQYDETTGAVTLPSTLVLTAPANSDDSTKVPTTSWTRNFVASLGYVTGNQSVTISGDATGSGTTSIELTLANTAVTPGTYGSSTLVPVVTVDSKGRITSVTTSAISGALTFTGDVTGTGTTGTSTQLTLANSGVTAGTYTKVTVDSKGRITVGASATTSDISEGTNLYYTDARVLAYLGANSYATQSYVSTQIANLIDSAPGTLDTLNELAAALGDDPNFATTVATSIGTKQNQLNGTGFVKMSGTTVSYDNSTYLTTSSAASTYVSLTGSYSNPSWFTSLGWSKITSTPTTISGYGITNAYTDAQIQNFFNGANAITGYNKSNWDTAYGWGNHASAGYLTTSSAASTYVSLTGSYANPSWITSLAYSKITGVPAFLTSYTETDTLASVTARGASTSTNITLSGGGNQFNGHHYFTAYDANGNHYPHYNAGSNANGSKLNLRMFDSSGNAILFYLNGNDKSIQWNGNTIYHAGNIPTWNQNTTGNAATVSSITGNTALMVNRFTPTSFIDGLTTSNFRSTLFGTTSNGAAIATARWNNVPTPLSGMTLYGTMIAWSGDSDTQGFLALNYETAGATVGGGSSNNITWTKKIAFSDGTGASGTWGINITGNADTVDGYHATNAASGLAYYASNGYLNVPSWIKVDTGIFSSTNNAHFRPNTGSYGSWEIIGTKGGWSGIYFNDSANTLMMNASESGHYNQSVGWQFRWSSGIFYISTGGSGGGTEYTALHAGNYNSYSPTLTGGGASGTWGINVTGNAATATAAAGATFLTQPNATWGARMQLGGNGAGSGVANIAVLQATDGNIHMDNGVGKSTYLNYYHNGIIYLNGGTYYISANGSQYNGNAASATTATQLSGYAQQTVYTILDGPANGPVIKVRYDGATANRYIDIGHKDGNGVYYEGFKIFNGGTPTWQGNTILHAGNYNSYSPTLTGGGASGTWGISITGNAATLGGYAESSFWRDNQNRTVNILNFTGVGANSGNANQSYAIYQEGGAWAPPFPDLCIGYHTGIKLGAYFGYNGIRFFNNSDFATQTFSVNDGDNHVRVAYNLYVGGTISGSNLSGTNTGDQTNISGNASTSTQTTPNYAGGVQSNPQVYFNNGIGVKVAMTGHVVTWSDTLWINGYTGGDVLSMCALHTSRQGTPRMWITTQQSTATSYGTAYEFITDYNIASQTVSKLNPLSGDSNYKLAYTADGARNNAGEWGRAVMYYVPNGQTYGIRVDRADAANNITDYTINQSLGTSSSPTFTNIYNNGWFRNNNSNEGLYNQVTTQHWSSNINGAWDASSTTTSSGIRFYTGGHVSSLRGWVYADSSNNIGFLTNDGNWAAKVDSSKNLTVTGDVTAYSDIRVKTNIETITSALDKVIAIRGVYYNRTDNGDTAQKIGVIAQEIQKILPQVVNEQADGMLSVSYGNIVAVLIEAIKEQQLQIEDLKNKLDLLTQNK
jgi:hypothetical protein